MFSTRQISTMMCKVLLVFLLTWWTVRGKHLLRDNGELEKNEDPDLDAQDDYAEFPSSLEESVPIVGKMVDLGDGTRERPTSTMSHHNKDGAAAVVAGAEGRRLSEEEIHDENSSYLYVEKKVLNVTKDSGESVRLRCEVRGRPPPQIQWFKNEAPLEQERDRVEVRRYRQGGNRVGSRVKILQLDIHDTGYYKCEATNGRHSVETTGILMVKAGRLNPPSMIPNFPPPFPHFPALGGRLPDFDQKDLGFCHLYRGVTCSQLIGNQTVYVKTSSTLNQMEEKLAAVFAALAAGKDLTTECRKYAIPFLCFVVFPLCDDSSPYPMPRHVCRDDCETLEAATCRDELEAARRHPLLAHQDFIPQCEDLSSSAEKEGQKCINLEIPRVVQVDHDQTCYEGRGENYRGPVAHSLSTHQCQKWNADAEFPELSGGHNFCRNPGRLETQPWCFIHDPHIRREVCDIPRCADYSWLYILLPSLVAIILLLLLLGLWCKRQRRKSYCSKLSPQGTTAQLIPTHHHHPQHLPHPPHPQQQQQQQQQQIEMQKFLPRLSHRVHEVPSISIRFLHELGEGIFGKVYRGELHRGSGAVSPVAIKTLREGSSAQSQQDFSREIESISELQHPNVVCLVGVCIRDEPLCMLFEYMFRCDLHEYLIVHSPHSDVSARSDDGTPHILELADFLIISKQIAAGMDYLSAKRYVHRDLAARNCLVAADTPPSVPSCATTTTSTSISSSTISNLTVKISDLGVSRNSCVSDYFRIRNTLLPVRWMAPESLLYGTFTTESDVWSFGVLLWEIFSYGLQPYFNYDNQEVIDLVCTHQLLPRPEYCPSYVYAIMNDCWHDSASHRPGFKEIYNRLCSVHTLHERAFSISHSVLTHNSSQLSSTGPSNKTMSTNLSGGTSATPVTGNVGGTGLGTNPVPTVVPVRQSQVPFAQSLLPPCGSTSVFVSSKMVSAHRTHQCEQV